MDQKLSMTLFLIIISMVHLGNCGDIDLGGLMKGGGDSKSIASLPCLPKLLPCQPFLGSSNEPTVACCGPLKDIIGEETKCLCEAFQNPAMLASINVTKDEILKLPKACGIDANEDMCKSLDNNPSSSPSAGSNSPSNAAAKSTDSPDTPTADSSPSSNATKGMAYLSGYSIIAFLVALIVSA